MYMFNKFSFLLLCLVAGFVATAKPPKKIKAWITKGDQSLLLQPQPALRFQDGPGTSPAITVNAEQTYQGIDGFGFALTGGSATLIHQLQPAARKALLKELFGRGAKDIGISYLRISIGASDLDPAVFSYDDLPAGQTDPELKQFSIDADRKDLIPVLKEILAINPAIRIMGSPWSPPVWMKDNGQSKGGSLLPQYYAAYAHYLVKYIQAMKAEGITIDAITPQNEPLHPGNNPSLLMLPADQANFIKTALGPAFRTAGLATKIIIYDHNLDRPDYPISILNDPEARKFIDGSAFHLYAGEAKTMADVHAAHPDKNLYFTEQWSGAKESFDGNLYWHIRNVIIGTTRNWSRIALEWNLASDPEYNPHTPGGCTECKGAITVGKDIKRNASYYIVAHASKFVPAGSKRIESNLAEGLDNVAFLTPAGKKVLIVVNDQPQPKAFSVNDSGKSVNLQIPAGAVATYVW